MKSILVASVVSLMVSILLTPYLIKLFSRQGLGQEIRSDGPQTHQAKRGTPTMGGVAIMIAMWVGYLVAVGVQAMTGGGGPTASGWLLLYLTTGLGVVGFLDDFIKLRKHRNLGLNKRMKFIGQTFIAVSFAVGALLFRNADGLTPASTHLSYTRDLAWLSFGVVGFVIVAVVLIAAWSNAVNFTDGLDGLAAGSAVMVLGTYVVIGFVQFRNYCAPGAGGGREGRLLHGARPARPVDRRGRDVRCLRRLPVVERPPGPDHHGRHRIPAAGRHDRRAVDPDPHRDAAGGDRRAVRGRDAVGGDPDPGVQDPARAGVQDGPVPPSLRAVRLGRDHGDWCGSGCWPRCRRRWDSACSTPSGFP